MADAVRLEYHIGGVRVMCLGSCDGTGANGCPICADDARTVARRDAAWREAVERERWTEHHPMCDKTLREARVSGCCGMAARNAALDALLAAMEGK